MSSKLLSGVATGKYKSRKIALKEASTAYMKKGQILGKGKIKVSFRSRF
jgi:hypothetical protein